MTWCNNTDCPVCAMLDRSPAALVWNFGAYVAEVRMVWSTPKPKAPVLDDGDPDTIEANEVKK